MDGKRLHHVEEMMKMDQIEVCGSGVVVVCVVQQRRRRFTGPCRASSWQAEDAGATTIPTANQ